jgi:hypothetical protein
MELMHRLLEADYGQLDVTFALDEWRIASTIVLTSLSRAVPS